ncbi:MAG: DoxX family protein [Acidobacteria bacterium]|nr:DoxX family protein [Acidobacteriota bacterium]
MKTVLSQHRETAYALLRMLVGFLFFCHGVVAVWFLFGEGTPYSPAWLYNTAGIVEFVTGALVLVGYQTRIAAFLASGQMAVAYFYRHQPDGLLPIQNDGELAALFAFLFLFIAAAGSGKWSIESCCPPGGKKPE